MRIFIQSGSIPIEEIVVKRENILTGLSVPGDYTDEYLVSLIDDLSVQCKKMCRPTVSASIYDNPELSLSADMITIDSVIFNVHKIVASALHNSTSVALFTATCGEETGKYSARLIKEGSALEGLIVDLIGSEIAEEAAEYVHSRIGTAMALLGLNVTNRYSPGYCNWPVSDQQYLFRLLDGNNCGIRLTESSLMLPVKSVSGIIGIGHAVKFRGYTCSYCEMDHCIYRNRRTCV